MRRSGGVRHGNSQENSAKYLMESFLLFGHVIQWYKHLVCLLIDQHRVSVAKCSSSDILPAKAHVIPCQTESSDKINRIITAN